MIYAALMALGVALMFGAAYAGHVQLRRIQRPHRSCVHWEPYGLDNDALDRAWLLRQWFMDERQARLDKSQNIFTRLV